MDAVHADELLARARIAASESEVAAMLDHLDLSIAEREAALERPADVGSIDELRAAQVHQDVPPPELLERVSRAAVVAAADTTAVLLETVASERSLERVNERDHQHKAFVRALAGTSTRARLHLSGKRRVSWPDHWPRVGDLDVVLNHETYRVGVELKCGARTDALAPCAWDAVKLATALALGEVQSAYLVAAAPVEQFTIGARGPDHVPVCAEFFDVSRTWKTDDVRRAYQSWFEHWRRNNDPPPLKVAAEFATSPVAHVAFTVNGAAWQQSVTRIARVGSGWLAWPTPEATGLAGP